MFNVCLLNGAMFGASCGHEKVIRDVYHVLSSVYVGFVCVGGVGGAGRTRV